MISVPVFAFESVCSGFSYPIEVPPECLGSKIVKWEVANPLPFGVSADDVVFSNPGGLTTGVTFPQDGDYYICVRCWD